MKRLGTCRPRTSSWANRREALHQRMMSSDLSTLNGLNENIINVAQLLMSLTLTDVAKLISRKCSIFAAGCNRLDWTPVGGQNVAVRGRQGISTARCLATVFMCNKAIHSREFRMAPTILRQVHRQLNERKRAPEPDAILSEREVEPVSDQRLNHWSRGNC